MVIKKRTKIRTNNISKTKNKIAETNVAKFCGILTFLRISEDFFLK